MKLWPLHKTVILIDTDFLNEKLSENIRFYQNLYRDKSFHKISLENLLYNFVVNARIDEPGNTIDVLFAYTLSNSSLQRCEPDDVFGFIDARNINFQTDKGTLRIRSFFADEDETCTQHFLNMLTSIYHNPDVSRIVMIADNDELNYELEYMIRSDAKKDLFMIKNYHNSCIDVLVKYVNIDYPIAYAMGLNDGEV